MNNKLLLIIDSLSQFLLFPIVIIFILFRKFIYSGRNYNNDRELIIKLMGAGNFIAFSSNFKDENIHLLTTNNTYNAVRHFCTTERVFIIDTSSLLSLLKSLPTLFSLYFQGRYSLIVNMESESVFAKFVTATVSASNRSGLSNAYRGLLDYFIYDNYIVSPDLMPKKAILNQLRSYNPEVNSDINSIIKHKQQNFLLAYADKLLSVKKLVIAPSCSKADETRRLPNELWIEVFNIIDIQNIKTVEILLQDKHDPQASFFNTFFLNYKNVYVRITSYEAFTHSIEKADVLITVDSQALHIAQYYGVFSFAFFGPTSPFGVNIEDTTYPISASLQCSPCTHKYFVKPCNGDCFCLHPIFLEGHLAVLGKINSGGF